MSANDVRFQMLSTVEAATADWALVLANAEMQRREMSGQASLLGERLSTLATRPRKLKHIDKTP